MAEKTKTGYSVWVRRRSQGIFGNVSDEWFATRDEAQAYAEKQASDLNVTFVAIHSMAADYNTTIKWERSENG